MNLLITNCPITIGDLVICINDKHEPDLINNKEYKVIGIDRDGFLHLSGENVDFDKMRFGSVNISQFEKRAYSQKKFMLLHNPSIKELEAMICF
jgi:hypothetical protein